MCELPTISETSEKEKSPALMKKVVPEIVIESEGNADFEKTTDETHESREPEKGEPVY